MKYIGEGGEGGFGSMYVSGVGVKVVWEFVGGGVEEGNGFSGKDNV